MCFYDDLAFGQKWEKEALKLLNYDTYTQPSGCFKPYDIELITKGKKTFIEVKSDRLASKTNNIAIGFCCSGKPSGISTTKADYWVYFIVDSDGHIAYKLPVRAIKKFLRDATDYKIIKGGDGKRSQMAIINRSQFAKYRVI